VKNRTLERASPGDEGHRKAAMESLRRWKELTPAQRLAKLCKGRRAGVKRMTVAEAEYQHRVRLLRLHEMEMSLHADLKKAGQEIAERARSLRRRAEDL